jgi:isopentenyl diphosphate isomerase/L-lactate dehydrogenase-like FMN-dependent dehydrogenase
MVVSSLATTSLADIAAAAPDSPRWFQVYRFRDAGVTQALIDEATDAGYGALVLTVDAPRLGRRERDLRTGFAVPAEVTVPSFDAASGANIGGTPADLFALMDASVTWRDLEELASSTDLPVLVKGVMTAEDAQLACEHGAAGVVVSNHGGRQLDSVGPTVDALPEVAEAVEGRAEVLVDGGIRRGADAVRALALGARAVLAGRAPLWGLAARGEQGAREVLQMLRDEVELALALTGCARPDAVMRSHVKRRA